jgi:tetratricopeptide (TPR) repeat protein
LHLAHRYDEAIEQVRNALKMDASFARGHWTLGQSYEQKENYSEAISELEKALELSQGSPQCLGALGHAYAVAGMRQKALRTLSDLQQMAKIRYVSPYEPVLIYTGLSEKERAFEWLERAFEDRAWAVMWLKVDPRLDPLRDDPRFSSLLRPIGLEQ